MINPVSRSLSLILGLFFLANLWAAALRPDLGVLIWLIDLRGWPRWLVVGLLGIGAVALLSYARRPPALGPRRTVTLAALGVLAGVAMIDSVRAWYLTSSGDIRLGTVITFSLLVALSMGVIAIGLLRPRRLALRWSAPLAISTACAALCGFPLAQMMTFGQTDYRRRVDAILVFGARTYSNGQISDALQDRMRTACQLYHKGLATFLILSGGPGDGQVHETQAMRRFALDTGIPESALIIDPRGVNTKSSVEHAAAISREHRLRTVMAVSHFYHLPRVKLQCERAGLTAFTVPAPQGQPLNRLPYYMAREVAACWLYVFHP